ncbi:hypothetical protein GTL21_005144 [Salmonella enterica]|nr:hypothetical protein [Salmonella enterica]HBM0098310.1 hypothetical protein [Salmonella enterica subsp. enterica serovar Blitta]
MKDFKTSEEVAEKIEKLMKELYGICSENGVLLVIGAGMARRETASKSTCEQGNDSSY